MGFFLSHEGMKWSEQNTFSPRANQKVQYFVKVRLVYLFPTVDICQHEFGDADVRKNGMKNRLKLLHFEKKKKELLFFRLNVVHRWEFHNTCCWEITHLLGLFWDWSVLGLDKSTHSTVHEQSMVLLRRTDLTQS